MPTSNTKKGTQKWLSPRMFFASRPRLIEAPQILRKR